LIAVSASEHRHVTETQQRNRRGWIDIGKNSFHVVGQDRRGTIVLRQRWSRSQVEARFANMPPCLIGMEACVVGDELSLSIVDGTSKREIVY
jgi:hypothetical protein